MKYILVATYSLFFFLCALDLFPSADFVATVFFTSTVCLLCALIASKINCLFAELFVLLQAVALVNYALMSASYAFFDSALLLELNNINSALLITDIIALTGVILGDRWLFSGAG